MADGKIEIGLELDDSGFESKAKKAAQSAGESAGKALEQGVKSGTDGASKSVEGFGSKASAAMSAAGEGAGEGFGGGISSKIASLGQSIGSKVSGALASVKGVFSTAGADGGGGFVSAVASGMSSLGPKVSGLAQSAAEHVKTAFKAAGAAASATLENLVVPGLQNVASVAATAFAGLATASVAAMAKLSTSAVQAYASYEQNVGGVQKLFGNMGQTLEEYAAANGKTTGEVAGEWQALETAQGTVLANARGAFETAGVSANQYMEQVTSFSAALINSLGGDTQKAAEQAQVAMVAMSDNVNTFGTDMQDVQNAFQGFAKQNYTMLDNLKLGYGGTKEEMQRLIEDANAYAESIGQASDLSIDSFSDIVMAVDLIQKKQNIAGTTAREAATTVEGSVNQMKAAWENWLTVLGTGDYEAVETATTDLVGSIKTALENVLPVVQTVFESLSDSLPELMAEIRPVLEEVIDTWGPPLGEAAKGLLSQVFQTLTDNMPGLLTILGTALNGLIDALILDPLSEWLDGLLNGTFRPWWDNITTNVGSWLSGIWLSIQAWFSQTTSGIGQWASNIWQQAQQAGSNFLTAISGFFGQIPSAVGGFLGSAIASIGGFVSSVGSSARQAGSSFLQGIQGGFNSAVEFVRGIPGKILGALGNVGSTLADSGRSLINGFVDGIKSAFSNAVSAVQNGLSNIRSFFPFSPAKRGPFSGHGYTSYSGRALMRDFAGGITRAAGVAVSAAGAALEDVQSTLAGGVEVAAGVGVGNLGAAIGAGVSRVQVQAAQQQAAATTVNQTVNFNQPISSPDEVARTMRLQQRYGLAGQYA